MKRLIMATAISATVFIAGCSSDGTPAVQGTTTPVAAATAPTTAPAAPAATAAASLSIFSGAYAALSGLNIDPDWDGGTGASAALETIAGNEVLKVSNLGFQGIEFGSDMDVSAMDTLHIDYWTENSSGFDVYAISSDGAEVAKSIGVTTGSWQSLDIPLSDFAGVDLTKVFQLKFVGNGDVYLDNIYFYDADATTTAAVDYIYSSDATATPNWIGDGTDFSYSDWSTQQAGDIFEGSYTGDADYGQVWQVKGSGWGSALAMTGFTAGFASGYEKLVFKAKLDSGDEVKVKFPSGSPEELSYFFSNNGSALNNGWYQMEIALSDFGDISSAVEFAIHSASGTTMLVTDIGLSGTVTAPVTPVSTDFVYSSDVNATPNWIGDGTDFSYSDWSTQQAGDIFEGSYTGDADYGQVWQVKGSGWGSALAMTGFTAGFASGYTNLVFKVNLDSGTEVKVKFPNGSPEEKSYDLLTDGTALSNGWYQMEIDMSDFGDVSSAIEFAIHSASGTTMLVTDIGFNGTVVAVSSDYVYSSDAGVTPNWIGDGTDFSYSDWSTQQAGDIFEGGYTGDADYGQVWQVKGSGWGSALAMTGFTAGFASGYAKLMFKAKLDSGDEVKVKFPSGSPEELSYFFSTNGLALNNGWYQMEIALSDFGDISSAVEFAIHTATGTTMYLTDIAFSGVSATPVATVEAAPTAAAPSPTLAAASVTSVYSDHYTSVALNAFPTSWSDGAAVDVVIPGTSDSVKKLSSPNGVGIEFTNTINASSYTSITADVWLPDMPAGAVINVFARDFGANGVWDENLDDSDVLLQQVVLTTQQAGTWFTISVPLSGLASQAAIGQMKFGNASAAGNYTMYVDNVYIH